MKKAQSIEDLKKEGLVKIASEIEPTDYWDELHKKYGIKKDDYDENLNLTEAAKKRHKKEAQTMLIWQMADPNHVIWLEDFLKRHKKRFEDFSIEIEEMYSEKPNKAAMKPKQGKEVIVQDFTKENSIGKPYNPMNNPLFLKKIKPNESK